VPVLRVTAVAGVVIVGAVIQGAVGFGLGLLAVPLLPGNVAGVALVALTSTSSLVLVLASVVLVAVGLSVSGWRIPARRSRHW
jgi:hypothetical protein